MHRNTFISSPGILQPTLFRRQWEDLFMAGQIIGVEGYAGNIALWLPFRNQCLEAYIGQELVRFPEETMIGAIIHYICNAPPDSSTDRKLILVYYLRIKQQETSETTRYILMAERALNRIDQISDGIVNA